MSFLYRIFYMKNDQFCRKSHFLHLYRLSSISVVKMLAGNTCAKYFGRVNQNALTATVVIFTRSLEDLRTVALSAKSSSV